MDSPLGPGVLIMMLMKKYYYWIRKTRTAACNTLPDNSKEAHQIVPLKIKELKPEGIVSSQTAAIVIHFNSAIVEVQNGATDSVIENTLRAIKNLC